MDLSLGSPLKMGGGIFTHGRGMGPPGLGVGSTATAACMAATVWANNAAPVGAAPGAPGAPGDLVDPVGLAVLAVVVVVV